MSSEKRHLPELDGVRGLAALAVVAGHARLQIWPIFSPRADPGPGEALTVWLRYGHFAVVVFIVLSGFCLMLPVVRDGGLKDGVFGFFLKCAIRILPSFYAALITSAVLIWLAVGAKTGTHWDISIPVTGEGFLANLLMIQDVWHPAEFNHAFWSVAVEWKIYFLFPALAWFLMRRNPAPVLALAVATILAVLAREPLRRAGLNGLTVRFVPIFAYGAAAAVVATSDLGRWPAIRRLPWGACFGLLSAGLAIACILKGWRWAFANYYWLDYLAGAAAAVGLIRLTTAESLPRRVLSWRPLVALGVFSYSLYLVHAPLLQLVHQYAIMPFRLGPMAECLALFTLGIPAVVAASWTWSLVFERPFVRLLKQMGRRRGAVPLANVPPAPHFLAGDATLHSAGFLDRDHPPAPRA